MTELYLQIGVVVEDGSPHLLRTRGYHQYTLMHIGEWPPVFLLLPFRYILGHNISI